MKTKNILLSIVLALSLPTNSEAITSYTANVLATISGSLGALFGASLMKSERGSNTEVLMVAAGFGCFTGKLTHLWLHGFTPEARLEKAQTINREINSNPLVSIPQETQPDYVEEIQRQRVTSKLPIFEAWTSLCDLDYKVKTSHSLLNKASRDAIHDTQLYADINTEQSETQRLGTRINNRLYFLKQAPAFMKEMEFAHRARFERKRLAVEQDKVYQSARNADAQQQANLIRATQLELNRSKQ